MNSHINYHLRTVGDIDNKGNLSKIDLLLHKGATVSLSVLDMGLFKGFVKCELKDNTDKFLLDAVGKTSEEAIHGLLITMINGGGAEHKNEEAKQSDDNNHRRY